MNGTPTTCAVIICTYRREAVLIDTLRQVLAQSPRPDELIVVDQTPEHAPETDAYLVDQERAGTLRRVRQAAPSLCGARNRGAQLATSDVLLFLDDDVVLGPQCVLRHARCYDDPRVSAVVQDVEAPDPADDGPFPAPRPVDYLRGFNFSVRREVVAQLGGFDEQFVASANGEESDFAMRLLARGHRILADPSVNVLHLKSPAGGCRIPGNQAQPEWTKSANFALFGFRHMRGAELARMIFKTALRAGPLRRENVVRPWRLPWAGLSFVYGVYQGFRRARRPVVSPFNSR